ncbi:MAG: RnfABCDGE type electron transport complex subunit D [Clostridia bacterium]|nr:RnfABCDGE type electron transport complex subunit D [Clostridia bacterium]
MDNQNLIVSVSPHIRTARSTRSLMLEVIFALLPAAAVGVVFFGLYALALLLSTTAAAVLFEYLYNRLTKKPLTIGDCSAALTGLLLAMNLPATTPIWQAVLGAAIAIVIVKMLFGGLGYNFANPAITARIILMIAFTDSVGAAVFPRGVDLVSTATPLAELKTGSMPSVSLLDLFLGRCGGALGETCALALLIGGVYLIARKIITWHTPVAFIGTVFLGSYLRTGTIEGALAYTLSGGLFLGAFFMATDYVTTPSTKWGRTIFGFGCGLLTLLIRFYGAYPEGVSFSILLMNILTPYIEHWTLERPRGGVAHE